MSATYSKRELGALMLQLIERRELALIAGDSRAAKSASQAYQTVHATWLRTLQRESGAPARAPELSWVERHPDAGARILVPALADAPTPCCDASEASLCAECYHAVHGIATLPPVSGGEPEPMEETPVDDGSSFVPITEEEALDQLDALDREDRERDNHEEADRILLDLLRSLGYEVVAERWQAARERCCFNYG